MIGFLRVLLPALGGEKLVGGDDDPALPSLSFILAGPD
jgi:hypothetical protein